MSEWARAKALGRGRAPDHALEVEGRTDVENEEGARRDE